MNVESFLEKITTPASPDNVLVVEASFTGLKAIVVNKKGEKLTAGQEAKSDLFDLNEAVAAVIKQVRKLGWKGQKAILVTPAVAMSVLDLNIPEKNKLHVQQVAETMQWEFEPVLNQHKSLLTIGQLLLQLGYLNTEQVDELLGEQNVLMNTKDSTASYQRVGELAMSAGLLSKKQLEDSLSRQQWFISEGDAIKCAWHSLTQQPAAEVGDYKWAVAGIKLDLLREWQATFAKCDVQLDAFYPVVGSGELAPTETEATNESHQVVLLEMYPGVMAAEILLNREPLRIETMPCTNTSVLGHVSDLVSSLGLEDGVPIKLIDCMSDSEPESQQLMQDVQSVLGSAVDLCAVPAGKITLPMRHAVRHFLSVKQAGYTEGVPTGEYMPPVMQRFPVRAVLAGVLVVGLIVLSEVGLLARGVWVESSIANISEDVNRIRGEIKRINTKTSQVNKLKADIKKKEAKKKTVTTMISLLTTELPERNQSLVLLMDKLQESITQDVVINSIREDTLYGFTFAAWVLNDQAAQEFVKRFQIAIHPLGFRIKNLTVNQQPGRLGLVGYSLNFSITQLSEAEWKSRKLRGNRPY